MRIQIAKGHDIAFASNGQAKPTSDDAAMWWESLTLVERAHLFSECTRAGQLNGPDAIGEFRNPT